ncbi:IclR family transcriptional regulator [Hoeflea olei]|uniref:Transcriptional regulator n=1 Tax=Hoeflea olei TaxID=1480615 RepID=A0A1C1Z0C8_9HYPH|nr:helix-turn-helix domain-containing protein [Hoeflea olei]OCW59231.1 transcriptional regulator [Hoeflea olei]
MSSLQTLSRGLHVLDIISRAPSGLAIAEIARELGVHRAIAYRLVATLEEHLMVARDADGRIRLGAGVVALGGNYRPQLRAACRPVLRALAHDTAATAFLCIAEGEDCVVVEVAEPDQPMLKVSYRVGSRHPVSRGAAGLAIAMQRPPAKDEPADLAEARRDGFAVTKGQLQEGAIGVAAPLARSGERVAGAEACIGVVAMHALDTDKATAALLRHRDRLIAAID